MDEGKPIFSRLSGPTKAYVVVNEFLLQNFELPQLKELLDFLVASDLERVGIMELIREELDLRDVSEEDKALLLGGLSGAPGGETQPRARRGTDIKRRNSISVVPFQRQTQEASPAGAQPPPSSPTQSTGTQRQPPKPPPLYPGQGKRTPRRSGMVPLSPEQQRANQEKTAPAKKGRTFFGQGAVAFHSATQSTVKPTILVADDDPRIRMVFRMKIQDAGYTVLEAANGDEAWAKIESEEPNAVVMDMKMPGLHGLEVLARLTQQGGIIPALVCSAYDQLKEEFVVANYPKLRYFVKPVNPDALLQALEEFVPLES